MSPGQDPDNTEYSSERHHRITKSHPRGQLSDVLSGLTFEISIHSLLSRILDILLVTITPLIIP